MIKQSVGINFDAVVLRIFPSAARLPLSPDVLTLTGLAATVGAGVAFAQSHVRLAGCLMVIGGVLDLLDGIVARARGTSSKAGAFLDSTMDRVGDLFVFGGTAVWMTGRADVPGLLLALWALGASFVTSYSRARAEQTLAHFSIGFMERPERFACIVAGALTGFLSLALWAVAVGATVTAIQRVVVAWRLLEELDRTGHDPTRSGAA